MDQAESPQLRQALNAVSDALRRGDIAYVMNASEDALACGFVDIVYLVFAGQARMRLGKPENALGILTRAYELAPDNPEVLNTLGVCLNQLSRPREAVPLFLAAVRAQPNIPNFHLHLATALEDIGELRKAQGALESAIELQPNYVPALARLAGLHARRGDFDAVRHRGRGLIDNPQAGPVNQFIALGILGDVLDAEGKPAEAFAAYARARELLRNLVAPRFAGEESAIDRVRRLTTNFRDILVEPWKARPAPFGAEPAHVFLVGFPRSGTTVLEQALASHPDVRTMEEVDSLGDTVGEYFYARDGMERFAALEEADLAKLREEYWARVAASGAVADRAVFIDKMPLNTVHQGLISRLFPGAKILFAIRDPRDVIFSCFRRRLVMSAHMLELSRFEGGAAFYDAVMTLAQLYRDRLGLPTLDISHEDMVADYDGQMRRVCDFIGVPFDDAMRDFAAHARDRDIKTPSANQVIKGLSSEGAGQWRKYREQFAPVLPILNPWAERFGYGTDAS